MRIRSLFTLVVIFSIALYNNAQTLSLDTEASEIQVSGTSTHNDWIVTVSETEGTLEFRDGIPSKVDLKFKVSGMDGGKGNIMNNIINKTLKESEHPWIYFHSESIKKTSGNPENHFESKGRLSIAGEEKEVTISIVSDNNLRKFSSDTPLKFTTFNMKPPTALFGALKTGDDIIIHCKLSFKSAGSQ